MDENEVVSIENNGYFHAVDCVCSHTPEEHNASGCGVEGCSCKAILEN